MFAIKPVELDDDNVVSINVPETDVDEWTHTSYDTGDLRWREVGGLQLIYRKLNDEEPPEAGGGPAPPEDYPAYWRLVGPTNKHAMFYRFSAAATTVASPLEVAVSTSMIDSLGFLGLVGARLDLLIADGGEEVFEEGYNLNATRPTTWTGYFTGAFTQRNTLVITGLPLLLSPEISVSLSAPSGDVSMALIVAGRRRDIGMLKWGVGLNITDFSRVTTDEVTDLLKIDRRGYAFTMEGDAWLDESEFSNTARLLADLRSLPALYVGVSDSAAYEVLTLFGIGSFGMTAPHPTKSLCTLTIKGMLAG